MSICTDNAVAPRLLALVNLSVYYVDINVCVWGGGGGSGGGGYRGTVWLDSM